MPSFNIRFTLDCPSRRAFRSVVGAGMCVVVERGQEALWVKGIEAPSREDALEQALEVGNKVLDQVALELDLPLTILASPRAIEFQEANGKNVRMILSSECAIAEDEVAEIGLVRPDGTVEVRHPSDEVSEVVPSMYDCTRFFRSALVAERLHNWFEAMRECFRAIEWVVAGLGGTVNSESIAEVLRRRFPDPVRQEELERVAVACGVSSSATQDLLHAVGHCLYVQHRNELDHAKALAGATYKLPFDPQAEDQVRRTLPLARFVARELIAYHALQSGSSATP